MGAAGRRALRLALALARLRQDGCPAARLTRAMQACAAVTTGNYASSHARRRARTTSSASSSNSSQAVSGGGGAEVS